MHMKVTQNIVWSSEAGRQLLVRYPDGTFQLPICGITVPELRDLRAAIDNALTIVDHETPEAKLLEKNPNA